MMSKIWRKLVKRFIICILVIAECASFTQSQQTFVKLKNSSLGLGLKRNSYSVVTDQNSNITEDKSGIKFTKDVSNGTHSRHKRSIHNKSYWANWGPWSECSESCSDSYRTRERGCRNNDGVDPATNKEYMCPGKGQQVKTCTDPSCPDKGEVGESEYQRLLRISNKKNSEARDRWTKRVSEIRAPQDGNFYNSYKKPPPRSSRTGLYGPTVLEKGQKGGRWTVWMSWGKCSKTCLGGTRERYRTCMTPDMKISLTCRGEFIERTDCEYVTCAEAKEKAKQKQLKHNPIPSMSGEVSQELLEKILRGEKVDANWGKWGSWGGCSASCETGERTRYRMCKTPEGEIAPACEGKEVESGNCNAMSCKEAKENIYSGLVFDFGDSEPMIRQKKSTNSMYGPYNQGDAPKLRPISNSPRKSHGPYSSGDAPRIPPKYNAKSRPSGPYSQGDAPKLRPIASSPRKPYGPYSAGDAPKVPPKYSTKSRPSGPYSQGDAPKLRPIASSPRKSYGPYSTGDAPRVPPKYSAKSRPSGPFSQGDAWKLRPIASSPRKSSSPYSAGDAPKVPPKYRAKSRPLGPYSQGDAPKLRPIASSPGKSSSPYISGDAPKVPPKYRAKSRPSGPYSQGDAPKLRPIASSPRKSFSPYSAGDAPKVPPKYSAKSRPSGPYSQGDAPKLLPIASSPGKSSSPYSSDSRSTGEWGEWMAWQQCSASCGKGKRVRDRKCDSPPPPTDGGEPCFGNNIESETCAGETLCKDGTMIHELRVTIGFDARLSCDAEWYLVHHPDATVEWYKDQNVVELTGSIQNIGLGDLQITKVNQQNEGVYACAITKDQQSYYNNVVLLKVKTTMSLMEVAQTQPQRLVVPIVLPLLIFVLAVVTLRREYQRMKNPSTKRSKKKSKKKKKAKKSKKEEESSCDDDDDGGGFGGPPPPPPPPGPGGMSGPPGIPPPSRPMMPPMGGLPPGPPSAGGGPPGDGGFVRPPMSANLLQGIKKH